MASRKDQERPEEDPEIDVRSLVSQFERFSSKGTDKVTGAKRLTPTLLTKHGPLKSSKLPDNKQNETRCGGLESGDKGYSAQRPTRSLFKEHGPTKSNLIPDNREKETRSPLLKSSDKAHGSQRRTQSLLAEQGPLKSNKITDSRRKETRSPGMERNSNSPKGRIDMGDYELLKVFQMPLCLIETDSEGKLNTCQDVLDQIREIDHPLNIVCIAGPYRTGKSYLLTRLAGRTKGFNLGSTIQSETKGIWVWCRPHPVQKDQVLLLLDTEGLGDIEKGDKNNDNQILALGLLLSSTMVYNILGKFSKDDLDTLSFVTEISKNIQFSDDMDIEESSGNFDSVFPIFILTLRDFTLQLKYEGQTINSDEYLENVCLKLQPETSTKNCDNNRARKCLMEYFITRKCFTFDTPGGRAILSELEVVSDNKLNKEFIEDTMRFTDYVYKDCPPKQMNNGRPLKGRQFVALAEQYVKAIRGGKVPNVQDALDAMIRMENKRAVEKSVEIYLLLMNGLEYPTSDSTALSAEHDRCFDEALQFFSENSMYDEKGEYYKLAEIQIEQEYDYFRSHDKEKSEEISQDNLERMDAVIEQRVKDGCYNCGGGHGLYQKDMEKLEADYRALTGLGCKKTDMLNKYKRDTASRGQIILQADNTLTENEKEMEAKTQKAAEAQRQQEEEKRLRMEQERLLEEEKQRSRKAQEVLMEKYEKDMQNERDRIEKLQEKRREEQERFEREGQLREAARVKEKMEKTKKKLAEYKNESFFSLFGRGIKKLVGIE